MNNKHIQILKPKKDYLKAKSSGMLDQKGKGSIADKISDRKMICTCKPQGF